MEEARSAGVHEARRKFMGPTGFQGTCLKELFVLARLHATNNGGGRKPFLPRATRHSFLVITSTIPTHSSEQFRVLWFLQRWLLGDSKHFLDLSLV